MSRFRNNVVSFTITVGRKRWYFVEAYVPSNGQPKVHRVEQALASGPAGVEMLMGRNLNARLAQPKEQHEEDLATNITN